MSYEPQLVEINEDLLEDTKLYGTKIEIPFLWVKENGKSVEQCMHERAGAVLDGLKQQLQKARCDADGVIYGFELPMIIYYQDIGDNTIVSLIPPEIDSILAENAENSPQNGKIYH